MYILYSYTLIRVRREIKSLQSLQSLQSLDHLDCGSGTGQCLITMQASTEAYVVNIAKQNMIEMLLLLVFA